MLDRGVCLVISGLQSAGGRVELGGRAEEEAVGQEAANAVVKEDEHEGDADAFIGRRHGGRVAEGGHGL